MPKIVYRLGKYGLGYARQTKAAKCVLHAGVHALRGSTFRSEASAVRSGHSPLLFPLRDPSRFVFPLPFPLPTPAVFSAASLHRLCRLRAEAVAHRRIVRAMVISAGNNIHC